MTDNNYVDYIKKEFKKFGIDEYTKFEDIENYYTLLTGIENDKDATIKDKKIYLCDYLLNDMVKSDEITIEQRYNFEKKYLQKIINIGKDKNIDRGAR